MEKDKIIQLTNALYKVTDLFPENEALKFSLREKGNSVLSFFVILKEENLTLSSKETKDFILKCKREIEVILSYFKVAENQEWIDGKNFEILKYQYENIGKELGKIKVKEEKVKEKSSTKGIKKESKEKSKDVEESNFILSKNQERVVDLLQNHGKLRPLEINNFFQGKNPRSIRRELKDLRERGIIVSSGSGKSTFYEMNTYY